MKKIKYLGLIIVMALMLTGCGSTANDDTDKTDKADKTNKKDNMPTAVNPPSETGYKGVKKIVYLDPTNLNKKCTESDVKSDDETRSGCMKWYVYSEDEETYTMILDHNTTNFVNWISKEDYLEAGGSEANIKTSNDGRTSPGTDKGPVTAKKQLESDTSYWEKSLNARLIKVSEIKEITGNEKVSCLDSNSSNKYGWLYDRTSRYCEKFGCLNNATKDADGYWTDTARDETWIYYMSAGYNQDILCGGSLTTWTTISDVKEGIRPVITVQKSSLSFADEKEN